MAVSQFQLSNLAATEFQDTNSAASAITIKGVAGTLFMVHVDNSANGAASFVKLYDTAGVVTVGTTAPDWIIKVAAAFKGPVLLSALGSAFSAGLQVATVTAGGTAGVTAPASAVIVIVVYS